MAYMMFEELVKMVAYGEITEAEAEELAIEILFWISIARKKNKKVVDKLETKWYNKDRSKERKRGQEQWQEQQQEAGTHSQMAIRLGFLDYREL